MPVGKCSCMTDIPAVQGCTNAMGAGCAGTACIPVGHGDMDVMGRRMWISPPRGREIIDCSHV